MALPRLLATYVNWQDRFVPQRPRQVQLWDGFWRHGKGGEHIAAVVRIERMIREGELLTPLLSDRIFKTGYVRPRLKGNGKRRGIEWGDKDYALNSYEAHHLHLGALEAAGGKAKRSDELIFVLFTRAHALILMVGDHKSFDDGSLAHAVADAKATFGDVAKGVTADPKMSWEQHGRLGRHGVSTMVAVGDQVVLGPMISTAGTAITHQMYADHLMHTIEYYEPLLDKDETLREWAKQANRPVPEKPRFIWFLQNCDLGVVEESTSTFYSLMRWRR